jgi:dihydroneopterin triphosphate diphosphatase
VEVTGEFRWGPDMLIIPNYAFGVLCRTDEIRLSDEHRLRVVRLGRGEA